MTLSKRDRDMIESIISDVGNDLAGCLHSLVKKWGITDELLSQSVLCAFTAQRFGITTTMLDKAGFKYNYRFHAWEKPTFQR